MMASKLLFVAAALALASTGAGAHVVLEPSEAPAASYVKLLVRVTHGCDGSPTLRLSVRLPEGFASVRPQPKPGWELEIKRTTLAVPLDGGHGKEVDAVSEITWSGGRLADEHFDEFALTVRTPDRPGVTLSFPVVQDCEQGTLNWIEVPPPGKSSRDLRYPAPTLRLVPRAAR
jgi:uncharacterized protein YcnI